MTEKFDVIIIGAGPGGLTSALYASRANLSVLIIERGLYGGQMNNTDTIDNYPGFDEVLGPDLSKKMYDSVMKFKPTYVYGDVTDVKIDGHQKTVITDQHRYQAPVVIIATGSEHKHLHVPGEEAYAGRGVSYCAVCDAAFFKNEKLAVIGGGDSAIEEGLYLAQLAKEIVVVHRRDQLRAQPVLQKKAQNNPKFDFIWRAQTQEIVGDGQKVTGIKYLDKKSGEKKVLQVAGVFIYVGIMPQTKPFLKLGITDDIGWIKTDDHMRTSVPGLLALGDVRAKDLRQIATAVGEGSIAGQEAYRYLESLDD